MLITLRFIRTSQAGRSAHPKRKKLAVTGTTIYNYKKDKEDLFGEV